MLSSAAHKINSAIINSELSFEDIKDISNTLSYVAKQIQYNKAREFMKGDKVKFNSRTGEVVHGTVVKINQKTVTVKSATNQWKVSPSLLKSA
jgi:flagellar basal body P-ring protein FlgI